jgi:hypothetical protein
MAEADADKYNARKAFWREIATRYEHVSDLESILECLSSDKVGNQLEKFRADDVREHIGLRIFEHAAPYWRRGMAQSYGKNLESILSALRNYNEHTVLYLVNDNQISLTFSVNSSEEKMKRVIKFLSDPQVIKSINNIYTSGFNLNRSIIFPDYLDFSYEESVSAYTNFILALSAIVDKNEDVANLLVNLNEKIYGLFGPEKSAGIFRYLMRRKDKTAMRKIDSLENRLDNDKIRRFMDRIALQDFGVKKAERLINLAYFLEIAENNQIEIKQETDLSSAYKNVVDTVARYFSEKYSIRDMAKIEKLYFWLKEFDPEIANILAGEKVHKEGTGRTYVLSDKDNIVLYLNPKDLETQMEALQNITSCLSPGGYYFDYTKSYLKNQYFFWAVIKANDKVVGRATICIGKKVSGGSTNPKISTKYSLCRISEIRSDVKVSERAVDSALCTYAKEAGMGFIKNGNMFIDKIDDIYDDYADLDTGRGYRSGVIAKISR